MKRLFAVTPIVLLILLAILSPVQGVDLDGLTPTPTPAQHDPPPLMTPTPVLMYFPTVQG